MPSQQTAGVYNLSAPVLGADNTALAALTCPYIAPLNRPKAPDIPRNDRDAAGHRVGAVMRIAARSTPSSEVEGRMIFI